MSKATRIAVSSISVAVLLLSVGVISAQAATTSCSFTRDLFWDGSYGTSGTDVTMLQRALINGGYGYLIPAGATGYFGSQTKAAVAKWQGTVGISMTGYFGALSRYLFNLSCSSTTSPLTSASSPVTSSSIVFPNITVGFPTNLTATAASNISIPVNVTNLAGSSIASTNFTLTYDPRVLLISGGSLSGSITAGSLIATNTPSVGTFIATVAGTGPFTGSGTLLLTLTGRALADGTSTLHWLDFTFGTNADEGAPNLVDGSFIVGAQSNPVPTTTSLSGIPTSLTAGGAGFTLTVNGTNFINGSIVNVNGVARTPTFVNDKQLTVAVPSSDLTTAGTIEISVTNPALGGGKSNSQFFTINPTQPPPSTSGITVQIPNGGETWALGTSHAITWSASSTYQYMDVALVGQTRTYNIGMNIKNTGNYTWNGVTDISGVQVPAGTYKARVSDVLFGSDVSDASFTITITNTASALPSLTARNTGADQTVTAGSNGVKLGAFTLAASATENIKIDRFAIRLSGVVTSPVLIKNLTLKDEMSGSVIGSPYTGLVTASPYSLNYFTPNSIITISSSPKSFGIYGDIDANSTVGGSVTPGVDAGTIGVGNSTSIPVSAPALTLQTNSVARGANTPTVIMPSLTAARNTNYGDQTAPAGSSGVKIGSFTLAAGSSQGVQVRSISITHPSLNYLANLILKDESSGATIGSMIAKPSSSNLFYPVNLNIPSSATNTTPKSISIYADILSNTPVGVIISSYAGATGAGITTGSSVSAPAIKLQNVTVAANSNPIATSTPVTIVVRIPNGAENWSLGTNHTITWTAPSSVAKVGVGLFGRTLSGQNYAYTLAQNVPNQGTYTWNGLTDIIGNKVQPGTYRVGVADPTNGSSYDVSDAVFTLSAPVSLGNNGTQVANALSALNGLNTNPSSGSPPDFQYAWNRDLQIGSPYVSDVSALQTVLTREGLYNDDITGGFYDQTYLAVKRFQTKYGIKSSGYVGAITREKLNELY